MEDAYGYCIYKFAGGFPSQEEVDRLCPLSGRWEEECRHAWVAGRMNMSSGISTEVLLAACGRNVDCTFELLDFRPDADVLVQLNLCVRYAGRHSVDCGGHAMQRWWQSKPDEEDVIRVAAARTRFPDKVGYYIAANQICREIGSCEGDPDTVRECERFVGYFEENPTKCPQDRKNPLHAGGDPGRGDPGRGRTKTHSGPGKQQASQPGAGMRPPGTPPPTPPKQ